MSRVSFSGEEKTIDWIWTWFQFHESRLLAEKQAVADAVRSGVPAADPVFFGMDAAEVDDFFGELGRLAMLNLLSSAEAALRIDFLVRVYEREKDELSRRFRDIHKERGDAVSLDKDILEVWRECHASAKSMISDFRGASGCGIGCGHGRYWTRKFNHYDPQDIFDICDSLLRATGLK